VLSGLPVSDPVVLFAPCFVLADGAGTDLALFLGSVEPLARVLRTPVLVSRDGCGPWLPSEPAPAGFPAVAGARRAWTGRLCGALPYWSAGGWLMPLHGATTVVLKWRWDHSTPALPRATYLSVHWSRRAP